MNEMVKLGFAELIRRVSLMELLLNENLRLKTKRILEIVYPSQYEIELLRRNAE